MSDIMISGGHRDMGGGYRVDVSRSQRVGRVSSEWFSRPDDQRFLSLSDLYGAVKGRAERSRTRTVDSATIRVEGWRLYCLDPTCRLPPPIGVLGSSQDWSARLPPICGNCLPRWQASTSNMASVPTAPNR